MSKAQRLSEKWFRFALWIIAVVFAGFLIGLGGTLVKNLPLVEQYLQSEDFIDRPAAEQARQAIEQQRRLAQEVRDALEQAQLKLEIARQDSLTARDSLNAWLASRRATQQAAGDTELLRRTADLERLRIGERSARAAVEAEQQRLLDAQQTEGRAEQRLQELEKQAQERLQDELQRQELKVFLYRLALTLPFLVVAGWLFARQRKSPWWPFVWGFIFFALFVFFVELVPYLPSYGGYVRHAVGILITVLVGRQAIVALNRYLERQRQAEARPDAERRQELSYDTALARLAKKVCPGCERAVELDNAQIDYCPHCGICLFDHCGQCQQRKSAFARFCHACGAPAARP
ncbi:zinc ribbon domain-containing protein [Azotobacter chroococcum]|uniref:zinc ribbon domain-containing protein n=1 Tax=Azotobacter chroococcum TaxID=353 RepID=UPI000B6070CF|nr:zinc ribbon domain-containing protein [Azotobacter chroococcum]ASL27582.1 serine endopeptidase [Azotobacter chroococcum]TBW35867.1 zinc ribbon domain-containing protein [Azotobacter chroococcum]TKD44755.1 serine endopeptidase [Azotobacter chroococcum]